MEEQQGKERDMFSFPIPSTPQDWDFEFGCLREESPTRDPYKNSPADHLFYNGKLLPHWFPAQQSSSCKSSLMSSRSNSVNSTRSSVSGRSSSSSTSSSSSDNSERRSMYRTRKFGSSSSSPMASKLVMAQLYGTSQRWQHIVPLPVLKREDSKRSIGTKKEKRKEDQMNKSSSGFCFRFLKSLLVTCRQCHSMEPSSSPDILQASST